MISKVQQFLDDIWAFQPHDAFLCTSVAEKIDAAVPEDEVKLWDCCLPGP
jgi:hypothetical protein